MPTPLVVTRRTVLRGAAVASAYVLSGGFGAFNARPAAATGSAALVVEDAVFATARYFDAGWANEVVSSFPVRFGLAERTEAYTLHATWDPRLFTVHGPAFALKDDVTRELARDEKEPGTFTVSIGPDVSEIVLQVETLNMYPAENLSDAAPTTLSLQDSAGTVIDSFTAAPAITACAPWGIEVVVDWVSYSKDIVPARITMTSVGPNAAPAGLQMLASYADVLAAATVTVPDGADAAPATVSEQASDGTTELTLLSSVELAPGTSVEVLFSAEESDSVPAPFEDFIPSVRLTPPVDAGMRASGLLASYPVTSSGSQVSTYLPAPAAV